MSLETLIDHWDVQLKSELRELRSQSKKLFDRNPGLLSELRQELAKESNLISQRIEAKDWADQEEAISLLASHMTASAACILISQMFLDFVREEPGMMKQ